jgi:D-3-phosphoglycerate dehydrogenase
MPKVLFIDRVHNDCQEILTKMGFECFLTHNKSKKKILEEIHLFEVIIIRSKFKITKEIINKAKKLKCIARAGAGMENIDVAYAESKGIKCIHAAEGNKDAVAEHAIAMLLSLFNNKCLLFVLYCLLVII